MLVLEINDAEIVLGRDGEVLYRQPGVAVVDPDGAVFGHQALARSRLHPQQTHNAFWQRLNADPVTPAGPGVANQADLVYLQLGSIRAAAGLDLPGNDRTAVVVAAPATLAPEQLAVLLGIAHEAGFDVVAIVDSAVAAACLQPLAGRCRVVDVSLHRSLVTQLDIDDAEEAMLCRTAVDEIPAAGYAVLVEGWVDVVADRFVDGTRFDPLRIAETEQQVYDQVVAGIQAGGPELTIEIVHGDVTRRVSVSRHALAEKSRQRYDLLARSIGDPTTLAISHRVQRLPGLASFLQELGHDLRPLSTTAVATGIAEHAARFEPPTGEARGRKAGARLVTALPARREGASGAIRRRPPTHLLCGTLAVSLGDDTSAREHPGCMGGSPGFRILRREGGFAVAPSPGAAVSLNGSPIDFEHPAESGDAIVSGGNQFNLITVVDPTGADDGA